MNVFKARTLLGPKCRLMNLLGRISGPLFLASLPIVFLIVFGRFGLEDSDSGFLVAMGWRILDGQLPYRDFIYIRPPLSVYWSALQLKITPEVGQVLWMRLINYYQLLGQVVLTTFILVRQYKFESLGINPYVFAFIAFLLTSTGTLYFQWHTTDGIFLAVLGFFILLRFDNSVCAAFLSGVIFSLAALTKQNYAAVPIIGTVMAFVMFGPRRAAVVILGAATAGVLFVVYLQVFGLLDLFLGQTLGVARPSDLLLSGLFAYFINHDLFFAFLAFMLLAFTLTRAAEYRRYWARCYGDGLLLLCAIFGLLATMIAPMLVPSAYLNPVDWDRIIPVLIVIAFLYLMAVDREAARSHVVLFALLGVSWASSVSWGGLSPIQYFAPVLFATVYLLKRYTLSLESKFVIGGVLTVLIAIAFIGSIKPYRNGYIWNMKSDAGLLSDKLAYIKTESSSFEKHAEVKSLLKMYPRSTILPSMPAAYYLYNEHNQFPMDWAMDVEANYRSKNLIASARVCCEYIIVETLNPGQPIGVEGRFFSSVTRYVVDNGNLIARYRHFDVYSGALSNN